jgi:hypothetical protein
MLSLLGMRPMQYCTLSMDPGLRRDDDAWGAGKKSSTTHPLQGR